MEQKHKDDKTEMYNRIDFGNHKDDKTEMYNGIGFALVILALCLGIGGCNYLSHSKTPLIQPSIVDIQLGK